MLKKMKKNAVLFLFVVPFFLCACASSSKIAENAKTQEEPAIEPEIKEKTEESKNAESSKPISQKEPSDFEKFVSLTENLFAESIRITKSPRETVCGKNFSEAFIISVENQDGSAAANFPLTVRYPVRKGKNENGLKIEGEFEYEEIALFTNTAGIVRFVPPTPLESLYGTLFIEPTFDKNASDAEKIAEFARQFRVSAPFIVRTDKLSAGGLISLVEFSANGKPLRGNSIASSRLLTAMMRQRFTGVGNADFTDAVLSGEREKVYAEASKLLKNGWGKMTYLIYGTIKPVSSDSGAAFFIDVCAMDLADGSILFAASETETGANDMEARTNATAKIAAKLVYGL